jgi:hypothetical protein
VAKIIFFFYKGQKDTKLTTKASQLCTLTLQKDLASNPNGIY